MTAVRTVPFPWVSVATHGAVGSGTETTKIQAAIDAAGTGGAVVFPKPAGSAYYQVDAALTPLRGQTWIGNPGVSDSGGSPANQVQIRGSHDGDVVSVDTVHSVSLVGLGFRGTTHVDSVGVRVSDSNSFVMNDCSFLNFGGQGFVSSGGTYMTMRNVFADNCLLHRSFTGYVGAIEIGTYDAHLVNVWGAPALPDTPSGYVSGWMSGILLNNANGSRLFECGGHFAENGIALAGSSANCLLVGCRGEFNQGPGYLIAGTAANGTFAGNWAHRNGRTANNTHPAFQISTGYNTFTNNLITNTYGDSTLVSYGFVDTCSDDSSNANAGNSYYGNRGTTAAITGELYHITGLSQHGYAGLNGQVFETRGSIRSGSGASGARPSASSVGAGAMWYDTTLSKPIWSNGSAWKDSAGTSV